MDCNELFLAGRVTDTSTPKKLGWRLLGVFTTEDKAIQACRGKRDFVRVFDVDVPFEDQTIKLSKIWFPLKKEKK